MTKYTSNPTTLILGVGNTMRHDDGIGIEIVRLLQKKPCPNVIYLEGGIDGLALLDEIEKYPKALIIDAVEMKTKPGTVKLFSPNEAKININNDSLSTHGFGIAKLIEFIENLAINTKLHIIGIQPKDISFGEGLTEEVKQAINEVLKLTEKYLSCTQV